MNFALCKLYFKRLDPKKYGRRRGEGEGKREEKGRGRE
jgi:hypothetical protein